MSETESANEQQGENSPSAMLFSTEAQQYLSDLLEKKQPETVHIRVFITEPGTPRAETCIAYCPDGEQKEDDEQVQMDGFSVFIEARSLPFWPTPRWSMLPMPSVAS